MDRFYARQYKGMDLVYYKARNYHIYGRFDDALKLYDIVIKKSGNQEKVERAIFFEGMVFYTIKKYSEATKMFEKLINEHPGSAWNDLARERLVRAHSPLGI